MKETTRRVEYTTDPSLYLAFELGRVQWKLAFSIGLGQNPRTRTIDAGDLAVLQQDVTVRSCYEAGRDGFWLHRYLVAAKVDNLVVDSSSIEVNRRAKRAKTDRLDAAKLLTMLIRYHSGEEKVWSVVQVPSAEAEDMRHLHRQLCNLQVARTRYISRIDGLLASQGVNLPIHADFLDSLKAVRLWDGSELPPGVRARIEREHAALQCVRQQIKELVAERRIRIETEGDPSVEKVRQLMKLGALGPNSAWLFVMEFFAWRNFRNRREVGGLAGLTPTPYQSGGESREQGISKAGNQQVRAMAIEIAGCWLRYQPDSALARWYYEAFGHGGKRMRKVGIVALARKLLVALWRYLETGEVPAGAQLKP